MHFNRILLALAGTLLAATLYAPQPIPVPVIPGLPPAARAAIISTYHKVRAAQKDADASGRRKLMSFFAIVSCRRAHSWGSTSANMPFTAVLMRLQWLDGILAR